MWDFELRKAIGLVLKTMPFLVLRMGLYFGITLGYILLTGTGAGLGWGIGGFGSSDFQAQSAFWGGLIGFGIFGTIAYLMREYILYIVKAGHIAVLLELVHGNRVPEGRSQVQHARLSVQERFGQASVLFALDQLIKGVIKAISELARGILTFLPVPGLEQLARLLNAFLKVAIGFIDELILAYAMHTRSDNPWSASKDALVLYGQNYKTMFKNAAWLALIIYGLSLLVFIVMLFPAGLLVYLAPGGWSAASVVLALLLAWSLKAAVLEPLAITCMMQVYFKTIADQEPNPEWDARLEQMSRQFRTIKEKARQFSRGNDAPEPAAANPGAEPPP